MMMTNDGQNHLMKNYFPLQYHHSFDSNQLVLLSRLAYPFTNEFDFTQIAILEWPAQLI